MALSAHRNWALWTAVGLLAAGCGAGHGTDESDAVLRGAARSGDSLLHYDRAARVMALHIRGRHASLVLRATHGERAPEQHLRLVRGRRAWRVVHATEAIVGGALAARHVTGAPFARLRPQCPVESALVSRRNPRYAVAYYACPRRFPAVLALRIGRRWTAYDDVAQYDVPFACTDAARGVVVSLTGACLVGTGA